MLLVPELVLVSGKCGTEAEAIPVRVSAPLVPVLLVTVNVPVVEMVEVVNVVVLLGVVVDVVDVVPVVPVVSSDIVPVDGRGGLIDTIKWLVVVGEAIVEIVPSIEEKMKEEIRMFLADLQYQL